MLLSVSVTVSDNVHDKSKQRKSPGVQAPQPGPRHLSSALSSVPPPAWAARELGRALRAVPSTGCSRMLVWVPSPTRTPDSGPGCPFRPQATGSEEPSFQQPFFCPRLWLWLLFPRPAIPYGSCPRSCTCRSTASLGNLVPPAVSACAAVRTTRTSGPGFSAVLWLGSWHPGPRLLGQPPN